MMNPFRLKGPFGADYGMDADDILRTKKALHALGHLERPEIINEFADLHMIDGLKRFQGAEGLAADGVMKPGGPTAQALGAALTARGPRPGGRGGIAEPRHRSPPSGALSELPVRSDKRRSLLDQGGSEMKVFDTAGEVGLGRKNNPSDVVALRRALAWGGILPRTAINEKPTGDNDLFEAIKQFQQRAGLKADGWIVPGGETATALDKAIAPEVQAYAKSGPARERRGRDKDRPIQVAAAKKPIPGINGATEGAMPFNPFVAGGGAAMLGAAAAVEGLRRQNAERQMGGGEVPNHLGDEHDQQRTDMSDPPPQLPPSLPRKERRLDKTEFPADAPFKEMDLSHPIPENAEPGIYVHPVPAEELTSGVITERKGNEATRKELERIRDHYEGLGWKHIGGGRYSENHELVKLGRKKPGDENKETHIPGVGVAWKADSRPGGHFTDLTFKTRSGRIVHIQSVDVDRNGKPTKRELDAAERIRRAERNTDVYLIPKGAQLKRHRHF